MPGSQAHIAHLNRHTISGPACCLSAVEAFFHFFVCFQAAFSTVDNSFSVWIQGSGQEIFFGLTDAWCFYVNLSFLG